MQRYRIGDNHKKQTPMDKEAIREKYGYELSKTLPDLKSLTGDLSERRVGIYMRAAASENSSVHSLELQKQHYKNLLKTVPEWNLYRFYIDEGTAQTSFKEMIADAHNHLIDLVLTRSLSHFSIDLTGGIETVKELARLAPPVGVLFVGDHLFSLDEYSQETLELIQMVENRLMIAHVHDGAILREKRVILGLTQQAVADCAGIPLQSYQKFESGKRQIRRASYEIACRVLDALEIDVIAFHRMERTKE